MNSGGWAEKEEDTEEAGADNRPAPSIDDKEVTTMPRGDGTGPQGQGQGSGRGRGGCLSPQQNRRNIHSTGSSNPVNTIDRNKGKGRRKGAGGNTQM